MSWEEIIVDRWLTDAEVVPAFAELLFVAPDDILIVDSISDLHEVVEVKVLCERAVVKGDFAMRLSIYLRDPRLKQLDGLSLTEEFCEQMHCACLISDESQNPYSMLLVTGRGERRVVYLDPERLDEHEEYVTKAPRLDKSE